MDPVSINLENDVSRNTRDAKTIMLLSLISIVLPPLFLVALVYFIIYFNKRKELKGDQSLSSVFNGLNSKTKKELRSIRWNSDSLEKGVAASILEHKKMGTVLIIMGILALISLNLYSSTSLIVVIVCGLVSLDLSWPRWFRPLIVTCYR